MLHLSRNRRYCPYFRANTDDHGLSPERQTGPGKHDCLTVVYRARKDDEDVDLEAGPSLETSYILAGRFVGDRTPYTNFLVPKRTAK